MRTPDSLFYHVLHPPSLCCQGLFYQALPPPRLGLSTLLYQM